MLTALFSDLRMALRGRGSWGWVAGRLTLPSPRPAPVAVLLRFYVGLLLHVLLHDTLVALVLSHSLRPSYPLTIRPATLLLVPLFPEILAVWLLTFPPTLIWLRVTLFPELLVVWLLTCAPGTSICLLVTLFPEMLVVWLLAFAPGTLICLLVTRFPEILVVWRVTFAPGNFVCPPIPLHGTRRSPC